MSSVFILLIFLAICVCYGYPRLTPQNDVIYSAFAGSSDEQHDSVSPVLTAKSRVIKLPDGTFANTKSFHRLRVNGTCMSKIDINNGDEWLAIKINRKKTLREQINVGDVILIYLADTNRYKIRQVNKFINDTTLDTYSYSTDNTIHYSSKPHVADAIMGVVKYRLSKGNS